MSPLARRSCLEQAVALLAVRDHARGELSTKLLRRGYSVDEIEAALDGLAARGYLDDVRAARGHLLARRGRHLGRARLIAELRAKGIALDTIESAFAELDDDAPGAEAEAELARAQAAAARFRPPPRAAADPRLRRAALARHLARRGFAGDVVATVLGEGVAVEDG